MPWSRIQARAAVRGSAPASPSSHWPRRSRTQAAADPPKKWDSCDSCDGAYLPVSSSTTFDNISGSCFGV